jgi:predicted  nucleic acid-binding Zn-ribbon protein
VKSILQDLYRLQTLDLSNTRDRSETDHLRAGIPAGMLSNYDRARARGRKGIALLRNHVCANCRMQSPLAVTISLKAGTVQVCGNCGLYLCLDPEEAAVPKVLAAPTPPKKRRKKAAEPLAK